MGLKIPGDAIGERGTVIAKDVLAGWTGEVKPFLDEDNSTTLLNRGFFGGIDYIQEQAGVGAGFLFTELTTRGKRDGSPGSYTSLSLTFTYRDIANNSSPSDNFFFDGYSISTPGSCIEFSGMLEKKVFLPFVHPDDPTLFISSLSFKGISTTFACAPSGDRTYNSGTLYLPAAL